MRVDYTQATHFDELRPLCVVCIELDQSEPPQLSHTQIHAHRLSDVTKGLEAGWRWGMAGPTKFL